MKKNVGDKLKNIKRILYRSYAPSLLHMYLTRKGQPERVYQRGSNGEGSSERVRWRGSAGEELTERVRRRRSAKEGPMEKIRRRMSDGEDSSKKVRRRRWLQKRGLTQEPTMALIPCEMREEKKYFSLFNK